MTSLGDLTFVNAILCEDSRREVLNKVSLMGVFSEDIMISEIPGQLTLSFYFEIKSETGADQPLSLKVAGPGEGEAILKPNLHFAGPGRVVALNSPQMTIAVTAAGVFRISASIDEEEWVTLISKKIFHGDASALLQPSGQSPPDAPDSSSQP